MPSHCLLFFIWRDLILGFCCFYFIVYFVFFNTCPQAILPIKERMVIFNKFPILVVVIHFVFSFNTASIWFEWLMRKWNWPNVISSLFIIDSMWNTRNAHEPCNFYIYAPHNYATFGRQNDNPSPNVAHGTYKKDLSKRRQLITACHFRHPFSNYLNIMLNISLNASWDRKVI